MRGIAKLLFDGDGDGSRLLGLLGGDDEMSGLAEQARRAGEWCGTTPGRGAAARATGEASRERPVRPGECWPR